MKLKTKLSKLRHDGHITDAEYSIIINALNRKPKERVISSVTWSGWIPATQLPEPLTAVLLTVRYKATGHWTYQMGYWEDTLERWEKWLEPGTLEEEFEIIAWMELPEKYEEDNDEW